MIDVLSSNLFGTASVRGAYTPTITCRPCCLLARSARSSVRRCFCCFEYQDLLGLLWDLVALVLHGCQYVSISAQEEGSLACLWFRLRVVCFSARAAESTSLLFVQVQLQPVASSELSCTLNSWRPGRSRQLRGDRVGAGEGELFLAWNFESTVLPKVTRTVSFFLREPKEFHSGQTGCGAQAALDGSAACHVCTTVGARHAALAWWPSRAGLSRAEGQAFAAHHVFWDVFLCIPRLGSFCAGGAPAVQFCGTSLSLLVTTACQCLLCRVSYPAYSISMT